MTEKPVGQRGRPITNKVDRIPASAAEIAKAIFKAADRKQEKTKARPAKKKPN